MPDVEDGARDGVASGVEGAAVDEEGLAVGAAGDVGAGGEDRRVG
jgi:hypothetical protein